MTRDAIARWIIHESREKRVDAQGRIRLYPLPKNDGGGRFEFAGINDRFHPKALAKIVPLVKAGRHKEAEVFAVDYIGRYVEKTMEFSAIGAVDLFLCDCAFNRGPTGAVKILQLALGVKPDGVAGEKETLPALRLAERTPALLLAKLRKAREDYENIVAPGRANLRAGLMKRWDTAFRAANAELLQGCPVAA